MPQDNAADFFKKKLAELDQTLPPEVTWNKTQGWQQLQPTLPIKRRSKIIWYQVAAAVAILVSGLFLLNLQGKKAIIPSLETTVVKQSTKSPLLAPPVVKLEVRATDKNPVAIVPDKARKLKNLKNPIQKEPALVNKSSKLASEPNPGFDQSTSTAANKQEAPLATLPEAIPAVQTPIKITVVLGGKTSRQLAVYAANEAIKVNRKKSGRIKVKVTLPNEAHPDDSAFAASTNLLPSRSALSAKIDL